jgi:hypothetical protein
MTTACADIFAHGLRLRLARRLQLFRRCRASGSELRLNGEALIATKGLYREITVTVFRRSS